MGDSNNREHYHDFLDNHENVGCVTCYAPLMFNRDKRVGNELPPPRQQAVQI